MISSRTKIFRTVLPRAVQPATANHASPDGLSHPGSPPFIRIAKPEDLPFVLKLSNHFRNNLGFLPKAALEWYTSHERCRIGFENGQEAGYLLGRHSFRWRREMRPITHAAIDYSLQRRKLGLELLESVVREAASDGLVALQAMCREDLEANLFWKAAGFEEIARYAPQNARKKQMICWRRKLITEVPQWFYELPPVAGWKARKTAVTVSQHEPT